MFYHPPSQLEAERPKPAVPLQSEPSSRYVIAAVDRALDVLEALQSVAPCGLAEVASAASCTRTAAFRLLRTLQTRGYATQDRERGVWRLGGRWPAVGRAAEKQSSLAFSAARLLNEASAKAGEHIYLMVRNGAECEVTAVHETTQPIRQYVAAGARLPLYAGPCRLLLADAPPAVRADVLAGRLTKLARGTQTDPVWIAKDIGRLQQRGWLATTDELHDGVSNLAAAVHDASRQTCAVLCVMTPSFRLRPPQQASVLAILRETAAQMSAGLGAT